MDAIIDGLKLIGVAVAIWIVWETVIWVHRKNNNS